jgi:hypothetical protein
MLCEIFEFFFPRQVILSSLKKRTVNIIRYNYNLIILCFNLHSTETTRTWNAETLRPTFIEWRQPLNQKNLFKFIF